MADIRRNSYQIMPNPLNFLVSGLLAAAGVATGESVLYRHNTTSHVGSQCACSQLGHIFGNLTIAKGAPGYAYESTNFWDKRCNLLPTCIFMPNSAEQVAKAVGIFNDCDAPFAVRGGGHMNVSTRRGFPWMFLPSFLSSHTDFLSGFDAVRQLKS